MPASNLPSPTGPHSRTEGQISQSRFERKIRRSFGRLVGAAPEAAENMIRLMNSDNPMVAFMATKFILSATGQGEISKQVQKTTQEIRMERGSRTIEDTAAKLASPEVDTLLANLQHLLEGKQQLAIEGEVIDVNDATDP